MTDTEIEIETGIEIAIVGGVVIVRGEGAQIAEKGDEAGAGKDMVEETGEAGVMINTRSVHLSEEEVIAGNEKEGVEEIVAPVQVHSNSQD